MKKKLLVILTALMVLISGCGYSGVENSKKEEPVPSIVPKSESTQVPEGSVSFTVINSCGGDIYEMYVSEAMADEFGGDILDNRIIKANDSMTVHVMPSEGVEYYDLKVLREDGDYYTWLNVPIGQFKDIDITLGDEGPEFTVK